MLTQPLSIDGLNLDNRVFMAPMSGVSDMPFRQLAVRAGAGMVVSEMVDSAQLCTDRRETVRRLRSIDGHVHVVQLSGRNHEWMADAARIAEQASAQIIDINMGCPAKKVVGGYSGAALMRDTDLACNLIRAVVGAVNVPVTVKMRLGWDEQSINAPKLAAIAEAEGAKMITVHGRTRSQFYKGTADWRAVRAVRDSIQIPLVVNGDIATQQDALNALEQSGADAVMVGRACYGQPWLCGDIVGNNAKPANIAAYIVDHYRLMLDYYGQQSGIRHARKHLDWYLQRHFIDCFTSEERKSLLTAENSAQVESLINTFYQRQQNQYKLHGHIEENNHKKVA